MVVVLAGTVEVLDWRLSRRSVEYSNDRLVRLDHAREIGSTQFSHKLILAIFTGNSVLLAEQEG